MHCPDAWLGQASLQGLSEFLREVTVLGVYLHPHIVPLLSFSLSRHEGQQQACLVYPLMARGGLDDALAARAARPLDAAARLRIAADAAAGLAYLHAPGGGLAPMLHRDIKSSNVLLDGELRARVSDVGLARPQYGATMTAGVGTLTPQSRRDYRFDPLPARAFGSASVVCPCPWISPRWPRTTAFLTADFARRAPR